MRSAVLLLALAVPAQAADPNSELRAALQDAAKQPLPRQSRYVTSYALPEDQQKQAGAALSLLMNSFSKSARIYKPTQVSPTLWRIDLSMYGVPATSWEGIVAGDTTWHIKTQVIPPGKTKPETVLTDSGAIDLKAAATLRELTGSAGAVMRVDYWVGQVATAPGYYTWADISVTSDGWYKGLGLNEQAILALRANRGAAVIRSGITRQPRRLSRWQGPAGAGWQSYDVFGDDAKKDPFANPGFTSEYDASELIASRPNGLHQYGLYNFKGERQNSVPERLAKDGLDDHGDGVLRAGFQCARCHTQKASSGLRDFGNDVKDLVEKGIEVLDPDPSVADALGGFYLSSKLARDLSRDREDYAAAVAEATGGLKPDESAKAVTDVLDYAVNLDVSPQDALRELGAKSLAGLRPSKSGVVLALYAGKPVKRTQFNAAFQDMLILVKLNAMP